VSQKVLVYKKFPQEALAPLAQRYELMQCEGRRPRERFSAAQLADVRVMLTAGGLKLPPEMLDDLPGLGAVICYGTGYDGIDLAELKKRNLALGHSPGANASSVADLALTLMLAATRHTLANDRYVRNGQWAAGEPSPRSSFPAGMTGQKIGVYGMGVIGRKIAARCVAFETEVGYFSRTKYDLPYTYWPSLEALAEWSDILVVAVRAGDATRHAVNAQVLGRLGENGTIINIARGSVIDQAALVNALQRNVIAGAGLDVYETEPHAPDALTALPNVVLTPHAGGQTAAAHKAMQDCVIANLDAFFTGRGLRYPVT